MSRDPFGAREELRQRIAAAIPADLIATPRVGGDITRREIADAIMKLFYTVEDDWDRIEATTLGDAGQAFIDQRSLVARALVQAVHWTRPVDRTVGP